MKRKRMSVAEEIDFWRIAKLAEAHAAAHMAGEPIEFWAECLHCGQIQREAQRV